MVISDNPPFVFIHIPCTAGRTIAKALENDERRVTRRRIAGNALWGADYYHYTYEDLAHMGPNGWLRGRTIFTFIRNPWARALSRYRYLKTWNHNDPNRTINERGYRPPGPLSFEEWLCGDGPNSIHPLDCRPQTAWITDLGGLTRAHFIGRFDDLINDWATITRFLGVDVELPPGRPQSNHYHKAYTPRAREKVERLFAADIARWSYKF